MEEQQKKKFWAFIKEKFLSRKLLVWATATALLVLKIISEDVWMYLSATYIGVNATLAGLEALKKRRGPQDSLPAEGAIAATPTEQTAEKDAASLRG